MKVHFLRIIFSLIILLAANPAHALFELTGEFGYKTQVYGNDRQNDITERIYSSSVAVYLFEQTALELNYSYSDTITDEHQDIPITGTDVNIVGVVNTVESEVFGIGIRQLFANRKAMLRPLMSLGYAKQFTVDYTDITIQDADGGPTTLLRAEQSKNQSDSVFASFSLELRLMRFLALRGSVHTVFPAFEFDKMKDYQRYTAGFTWIF